MAFRHELKHEISLADIYILRSRLKSIMMLDAHASGGTVDSRPMLAWIFANEEYTELYHQYFSDFIENYFTSGKFAKEIDDVKR